MRPSHGRTAAAEEDGAAMVAAPAGEAVTVAEGGGPTRTARQGLQQQHLLQDGPTGSLTPEASRRAIPPPTGRGTSSVRNMAVLRCGDRPHSTSRLPTAVATLFQSLDDHKN